MNFVDTHCHIHSLEFFNEADAEVAFNSAVEAGVTKLVCVATSLEDSKAAIAFARKHPENCWATVGIHPHEAKDLTEAQISSQLQELAQLADDSKVVGVGECGFDFYYNDQSKDLRKQTQLLKGQLEIAKKYDLPLSFHVRDAFEQFWPIFEQFKNIRGVLHSFTDSEENLQKALSRGLKIGVNGIATFTTKKWQTDLFRTINIDNVVLETDAPFLTPKPHRGKINTPENVIYITNYMAELRGEAKESIAKATTASAIKLFNLA